MAVRKYCGPLVNDHLGYGTLSEYYSKRLDNIGFPSERPPTRNNLLLTGKPVTFPVLVHVYFAVASDVLLGSRTRGFEQPFDSIAKSCIAKCDDGVIRRVCLV